MSLSIRVLTELHGLLTWIVCAADEILLGQNFAENIFMLFIFQHNTFTKLLREDRWLNLARSGLSVGYFADRPIERPLKTVH